MKEKPAKKIRRVVLGVGHPWFINNTVSLSETDGRYSRAAPIKWGPLGNWNKIRLVAEVIK